MGMHTDILWFSIKISADATSFPLCKKHVKHGPTCTYLLLISCIVFQSRLDAGKWNYQTAGLLNNVLYSHGSDIWHMTYDIWDILIILIIINYSNSSMSMHASMTRHPCPLHMPTKAVVLTGLACLASVRDLTRAFSGCSAAHISGSKQRLKTAAQKGNDNDPLPAHSHSHIAISRNSEPGGPCNDPAKWAEASSHPRRAAYSAQPPEPTSARFCCSWPLSFPRLRRSTLLLSGSWWLWPWRLLHSSNPSARCLQDQEMPSCQPSFWPSLSPAQG